MSIVQAKLQQCINSGQMNSFDRISNLFAGNTSTNNNTTDVDDDEPAMERDEDVLMATSGGKDASKMPNKKSKSNKHAKGMYGDKTSRKVGDKRYRRERAGKGRSSMDGRKGAIRSSSKKKSGSGKR